MHSDKKLSKEDTWRPADLRRHVRDDGRGDDYVRRRDDNERRHRGGESTERHRRDPGKESRRERDREHTRERRDEDVKDRYAKQGTEDTRGDKERDRRDERDRDKDKERRKERDRVVGGNRYSEDYRENRERRRDREDRHDRDKDKDRHRDKEDTVRERERRSGEDKEKRREERDKERRREERDREHRGERERRRHEESGEVGRDRMEKYEREQRDRHRERERPKDEREEKRGDRERRDRHRDKKHSEQKEDREYREEHRRHKEDRDRRHRATGYDDHRKKHESESREHRDSTRPGEEERHHHGNREPAERDKHRDRRHKEDDDGLERIHRDRRHREEDVNKDRITSKKSASDKTQMHETNTVKTTEAETVSERQITSVDDGGDTEEPVVYDEDVADQEYEDDFEDYEEDFEELDESENEGEDEKEPQVGGEKVELMSQERKEIEAIQRAMDEENERAGTAQSRQSMTTGEDNGPKWSRGSEKNQSRASQRGRFIDFVAAKQREVSKNVATKQKKRSTELLRLIDLDFSMMVSLLDLPPVNEYDMYIRTFGTANTKQAYVQCNEDNADRDVQTEEIEVREKWTQHPPEHTGACGDPNISQEEQNKNRNEMNFDSQRLSAFLRSASQVMVVLLEEDHAERKSLRKLSTQSDTLSFSDGSLQLNTKLPFLYGRPISLVHFSQVQRHTMMSVHTPTTIPSAVRLDSYTIICIWNIWEPSRPQKVLVYESEVHCCCFSPGKAILVFAGTSVGSVVMWDLREQAGIHYSLKIGEDEWTFRQPTFSTDAVMSGHFSPVSSVEVVPSTVTGDLRSEVPLLASEEESSGLSFQLASLDESRVLNFWVVVELPKANEAGSSTDLGLRPGGKVKLLHSSSLLTAERASPRDAVKTGPLQTLHLKFLPSDSNHFFVGTNMSVVSHETSHGLKAAPKFYTFQEAGFRPVEVTAIQFSPFRPDLFLVGCADGCIRLHAVSQEKPLAEWRNSTAGEPVVLLQWTQTRPTVFCVLDAASNLHIWDLMKNETEPVLTERISADRVTTMAVFGDSGKQNTYSGIALVHASGKIEMHFFTTHFTVHTPAEEEKLESMMTEAL